MGVMHSHNWKFLTKGNGQFPKENVPDPLLIVGTIYQCECGKRKIVPEDPRLTEVEVEVEVEFE